MRLATLLLGIVLTTDLLAQGTTTTVAGNVRDDQGRPIREALVVIDADSANSLRARTDVAGRFRIAGVSMGTHELRVVRMGFAPHSRAIDVGADIDIVVTMSAVPIPLDTVAIRVARLGLHGQVVTRGMELLPHEPRPLRGAIIEVLKEPYRTTSASDGRFSIGELGEGGHSLLVRLDRYATRMVPVYVPPDGGVEITVVLDSVIADYQRRDDDRLRSISQRLRLAPNPAAFVSIQELAGVEGRTLHEALRFAPSTLSRGLVVRNDITCLYVDGVPRPGLTAEDVLASDVQAVEVYGVNPQAAVPLGNVAPWNPNTFCGTGSRPGVFAAPTDRPQGDRPPRTVAGDNIARVLLIWTTRRR